VGASLESKPPSVRAFRHWQHSAERHTRALAGLHGSPLFWLAPAGIRRFIRLPRDLSLSASWHWRGAVSFLCQSQSSRPTPEEVSACPEVGGLSTPAKGSPAAAALPLSRPARLGEEDIKRLCSELRGSGHPCGFASKSDGPGSLWGQEKRRVRGRAGPRLRFPQSSRPRSCRS